MGVSSRGRGTSASRSPAKTARGDREETKAANIPRLEFLQRRDADPPTVFHTCRQISPILYYLKILLQAQGGPFYRVAGAGHF